MRVFRQNGRDGLSFLVAQPVKYIPIGDKIELNLGPDPEVIFELIKLRTWRDTVWMQVNGAGVFRQVDQPGVQIDVNSSVVGWDDHTLYSQRVRNYTKKPIDLEVRRVSPATWSSVASFPPKTTTIRRSSTRPRCSLPRRLICCMRSLSTRAVMPSSRTSRSSVPQLSHRRGWHDVAVA